MAAITNELTRVDKHGQIRRKRNYRTGSQGAGAQWQHRSTRRTPEQFGFLEQVAGPGREAEAEAVLGIEEVVTRGTKQASAGTEGKAKALESA